MAVPYTFANATTSIPLSQLDSNFATAITIGNTAVYLGNTTTSFGNVTLTNATISSGNVTVTKVTTPTVDAGSGNALTLQSNSTTGLYIDTSQRVGIGTTSPAQKLDVAGNITQRNTNPRIDLIDTNNSNYNWFIQNTSSALRFYDQTVNSERMRIDSSGNLLVGVASNAGGSGGDITAQRGAGQGVLWLSTSGSLDYGVTNGNFSFKNGLGGGYSDIYYQVAHPASDQIWKENVKDISYGLTEVLQLKPRDFTWIESKKESIGFIAQEIQPIIPKIVSADRDGHLSVEYDKIVAILTKAIQELKNTVDEQSQQIAALQSKVGA
jgi:Chaperone of endosialidase